MIWRLLALFLALATLSAGPVAEAAPVGVAQGSVTKIEIVGNERIEEATVLAAIDEYEKAMKLAPDNRAYREAHGRACIIYESDYAVM